MSNLLIKRRRISIIYAVYRVWGYCHKINLKSNRFLQNYAIKGRLPHKRSAVQRKFYCKYSFKRDFKQLVQHTFDTIVQQCLITNTRDIINFLMAARK